MRHSKDGRQFSRNTSHRKAMFRNMANSVLLDEKVQTTVQKAKEVRRVVDRLITLAKKGVSAEAAAKDHAFRTVFSRTRRKDVVKKLFGTLAERYSKREGGYTRVLKVSKRRRGDGAEMAVLELVDHAPMSEIRQGKRWGQVKPAAKDGAKPAAKKAAKTASKKAPAKADDGEKKEASAAKKAPAKKKAAAKKKPAAKKKTAAKK